MLKTRVRYIYYPQYEKNDYRVIGKDESGDYLPKSSAHISSSVYTDTTPTELLSLLKFMMDNKIPLTFREDEEDTVKPFVNIDFGEQYYYRIVEINLESRALIKSKDDSLVVVNVYVQEDWL